MYYNNESSQTSQLIIMRGFFRCLNQIDKALLMQMVGKFVKIK